MIFIITDYHVKKNCKRFGFASYDKEVIGTLNRLLYTFLEKKIAKASARLKGASKIEVPQLAPRAQSGGRVLMPSEYYGVPSNHYSDTLSSNGVDMTVNNAWIRPQMDLVSPMEGGANMFVLSLPSFKSACMEVAGSSLTVSPPAQRLLHKQFVTLLGEVLEKTARKGDKLCSQNLNCVVSMKKFAILHKN